MHGADRTQRYPTSWSSGHQVPDMCLTISHLPPTMILITARHVASATCTPRDKETWFSKWNKDKGKSQNVPNSNSNLAKSMTYHNQIMKLTTRFLNRPLDEFIDNKKVQSLKFGSKTPWSTARRSEKPSKAQEGHIEEGKATTPIKYTKSDKPRKRVKKSSKSKQNEQEKLKLKTSSETNSL
jgi:hypothetical protein